MTSRREDEIRLRLERVFTPLELSIKDQSQLHIGHEGAKDGKGHFDVTVISQAFAGINRLQRHRMVYDALRDLLESDIHALRITAYAPSERRPGP
jgi:BolA family transcriptional regulator, general stress-responsive regulator